MFDRFHKPLAPITVDPAFLPHLVETVVRVVNTVYPPGLSHLRLRVLADDFDAVAAKGRPDDICLWLGRLVSIVGVSSVVRTACASLASSKGIRSWDPVPIVTSPVWLVDPASIGLVPSPVSSVSAGLRRRPSSAKRASTEADFRPQCSASTLLFGLAGQASRSIGHSPNHRKFTNVSDEKIQRVVP